MFEIFLPAEVALQSLLEHHLQVPQKHSQFLLESSQPCQSFCIDIGVCVRMWVWVEEGCESFVNFHECIPEGVYEGIRAYDADSSEQIDASELH